MRLEDRYRKDPDGMFYLNKRDLDDIADMVLGEYAPEVLQIPQPLDVLFFAENSLYLTVQNAFLTEDDSVLGMIAFHDTTYTARTIMHEPEVLELQEGTVVLDINLWDKPQRKRYTLAHECSHWILHRTYHSHANQQYDFRRNVIACRSDNIEGASRSAGKKWTANDREEWQADSLAAALLMPRRMFTAAFYDAMRDLGLRQITLSENMDFRTKKEMIHALMRTFDVSYKATEIRLRQLDLLQSC